jgi:hypothetical protein
LETQNRDQKAGKKAKANEEYIRSERQGQAEDGEME